MSKATVSCPKCRAQMNIPRMSQLRFHCESCGLLIEAQHGEIVTDRMGKRIASASVVTNPQPKNTGYTPPPLHESPPLAGPNWGRIIGVAAAVILFVGGFFYWFSQMEKNAYEACSEKPSISSINNFLRQYPDGDYRNQAVYLKDSILYQNALTDFDNTTKNFPVCECGKLARLNEQKSSYKPEQVTLTYEKCLLQRASTANTFKDLEVYKNTFSGGQYLDSVAVLENNLWSNLNAQYANRTKTQDVSTKAKRFVKELLAYGQKTQKTNINIRFESVLDLQDWKDYPQESRDLADMLTGYSNKEGGTNYPLPSESPPPSIRNGFSASDNTRMQSKIVDALQLRLDSVFMPNPFIINLSSDSGSFNDAPNITVDYKIETLAGDYTALKFPNLYVHTEETTYGNKGTGNYAFKGYILATGVKWDMQFKIPDNEIDYNLKTDSRPNSSFSGLRNMSRVYQLMMQSTFENYALTLANGIGL